MYAVTFALPDESREFRKLLATGPREDALNSGITFGTLYGVEVAVAHIGVGERASAKGITGLLQQIRPELVICAGYGGALDPGLRVGDLVLDLRHTRMQIPGGDLRTGTIHTVRQAAESVEDKRALRTRTGADVVDMETSIVDAACSTAGVPMLGLRVISDVAEQPLPVPMASWFDIEAQRPRVVALLRYLLAHPLAIAPFFRFVAGLAGARARLAAGLSAVIAEAAVPRPH